MLVFYYNALQSAPNVSGSLPHAPGNPDGLSQSSMDGIVNDETRAPANSVAGAVGNILAPPYEYGAWPADRQDTDVPSLHASQFVPGGIMSISGDYGLEGRLFWVFWLSALCTLSLTILFTCIPFRNLEDWKPNFYQRIQDTSIQPSLRMGLPWRGMESRMVSHTT